MLIENLTSLYSWFAKRTLQLDFEPVIDTFTVIFVSTLQSLDHFSSFEIIKANCAVWFLIFWPSRWGLFVFECCIGVNDSPNSFWWKFLFFLFILELLLILLKLSIGLWIYTFFIILIIINVILIVLLVVILLLILEMMLSIGRLAGVKGVSIKV